MYTLLQKDKAALRPSPQMHVFTFGLPLARPESSTQQAEI